MEIEDHLSKILNPCRLYICLNHDKPYDKNSLKCFDPNANLQSNYINIPKFQEGQFREYSLHKGILVLDNGQIDDSNIITDIGNRDLERILGKKGFESLGRVDNLREGVETS